MQIIVDKAKMLNTLAHVSNDRRVRTPLKRQ